MSYQERLALYRKIENLRGHPLICYVTSIRPQASGRISSDVIPEFISLHMKDGSQTKAITETLSRSYHHHGYPLRRSENE
jgi:hypothetical protein